MATQQDISRARALWEAHSRRVQALTAVSLEAQSQTAAERERRIARLLHDYAAFCEYYFPHYLTRTLPDGATRTVRNAPFHNEAARLVRRSADLRAVFMWPRGHAKSTHFDIFIPLWLMLQKVPALHFAVIVGKSEDSAIRLLSDVQAELEHNQRLLADFGAQRTGGDWADGEFKTRSGARFLAAGRGQSPRGLRDGEHRPDYIVIDDLDDDELCRNERRVRELTDWVREALFGAMDVGRGRFIMVGNLISKTSVLANIAATKGVRLSRVQAVGKDGEPVWAGKWTREEAQAYADFVGYRAWQKEMMHNPIQAGAIFRAEWIRYKRMLPLDKYDMLVCYTDPSFRSTTANDYKASRLWGKTGTELHLIDCYVRQDTVSGMVRWLYNLYDALPGGVAVSFYMEANFMQDIILDEFAAEGNARGHQLPILADRRKKPEKLQRIEAVSPLWERGCVYYNEALRESADMQTGIEQTLALERGSRAHDDAPDADEGAIWYLQRGTRQQTFQPVAIARRPPKNYW